MKGTIFLIIPVLTLIAIIYIPYVKLIQKTFPRFKRLKIGIYFYALFISVVIAIMLLIPVVVWPSQSLGLYSFWFFISNFLILSFVILGVLYKFRPRRHHFDDGNGFLLAKKSIPIVKVSGNKVQINTSLDKAFADLKKHKGEPLRLPSSSFSTHVHIIGQTGSGKTKSVLIPIMQQAIRKRYPVVVIDPKGDDLLLKVAYEELSRQGREDDLALVDLEHIDRSVTWNPLASGTPEEIAARIIATLPEFKDPSKMRTPFFAEKQAEVIKMSTAVFGAFVNLQKMDKKSGVVNFIDLYTFTNFMPESIKFAKQKLYKLASEKKAVNREEVMQAINWMESLLHEASLSRRFREFITGLTQHLSKFAHGKFAKILNSYNPDITLKQAITQGKVVVFLLHSLSYPDKRAEDVGTMALMELQSVAASRLRDGRLPEEPTIVLIDEAQVVISYPFLSMFDMARSSGIGVVLAHQVRSQFSEAMMERIEQNTALKIIMRTDEPTTREYYSKMAGETIKHFKKYSERGESPVSGMGGVVSPDWGETKDERYDYILRPELLSRFDPGEGIVFYKGNLYLAKMPLSTTSIKRDIFTILPHRSHSFPHDSEFTRELKRYIRTLAEKRSKKDGGSDQGKKESPDKVKPAESHESETEEEELPKPQGKKILSDDILTGDDPVIDTIK